VTASSPESEFSRPFPIDRLGAAEAVATLEATPEERVRLAERFGLVSLDRFAASVKLQRREGGLIRVGGRLEAEIVQTCVVTLEDFPSHVEDSFSVDFTEAAAEPVQTLDLDIEHDPPEPVQDGIVDIGELAAQYLSLALDPHPRAPGAAIGQMWSGEEGAKASPFAVLQKLKPHT
jgi:hypothetical protein